MHGQRSSTLMAGQVALLFTVFLVVIPALGESQIVVTGQKKPMYSALVAQQWKFSLPEAVLQRTFMQQGCTGRLKQVILRLLEGKTVRIGALGGSVTVAREDMENGGYFNLTGNWIKKAFPKANVIVKNGAVSGSSSMYTETLMGALLDPGVDLTFIEYAVNNRHDLNTMFYEDVASFERMLRLVLTGDHAPPETARPGAAVIVNVWRCCRLNDTHYALLGYHEHTGDHYHVLAQYYGVPTISVRNGLYHAYRRGQALFTDIRETYPPNSRHSMVHPNTLGHRYMADMIIYAIYMVLAQIEQFGVTAGDRELASEPLPPPMVTREERLVIHSYHAQQVLDVITKNSGWVEQVEHTKFSMVTHTPGSKLTIKLDTKLPRHYMEILAKANKKEGTLPINVVVYLGFLRSYEHRGVFQATCIKGCVCSRKVFDTNDPSIRTSVAVDYHVAVSQSPECVMELLCLDKTSSGDHKLALRGIAIATSLPANTITNHQYRRFGEVDPSSA